MMKKGIALLAALCLMAAVTTAWAAKPKIDWTQEERAELRVGNATSLSGCFFTTMWGATTSDLDVQDLLHGYALARYNIEGSQFLFDSSVVQDAVALDDEQGNRTYLIALYNDLKWSDGTAITAKDYAFSILFCMDKAIAETGGKPMDYGWISGAEEYLAGEKPMLAGLRILGENILQVTARAESLPYFYELRRFAVHPYPATVIAPGIEVMDDGEGAYLSGPLTAEMIRETVLDGKNGYLSHPQVVSGPYRLVSYIRPTARMKINPYYKGSEKGFVPRIGEVEYTQANNTDMLDLLGRGEIDLLNKVTLSAGIRQGLHEQNVENLNYSVVNYPRVGLTMLWFMENSPAMQEKAVREAIARSFDREQFTGDYTGPFGIKVDGMYGIGQWMYMLAKGQIGVTTDEVVIIESSGNAAGGATGEPEAEPGAGPDYSRLNLDGLTLYEPDTKKAAEILEKAGWKLNGKGIRSKKLNGQETELRLRLGMPRSSEARDAMIRNLVEPLKEIGVFVEIRLLAMEEIEEAYFGEGVGIDLLYLGENFSAYFDPEILKPRTDGEGELTAARQEVYGMAQEMVRTAPADIWGFMQKWIALQEKISETLPLLPVYSNVYFDFYTRQLHDYEIMNNVTWGEAIVACYMSDIEDLDEEEKHTLQDELVKLEWQYERLKTGGMQ